MIQKIIWTRRALREVTLWIAAFTRDEIELRAFREATLVEIERVLIEFDGHPPTSNTLATRAGQATIWEYVGNGFWLVFQRRLLKRSLWQRIINSKPTDAIIVTGMRRPPTSQELEALLESE